MQIKGEKIIRRLHIQILKMIRMIIQREQKYFSCSLGGRDGVLTPLLIPTA